MQPLVTVHICTYNREKTIKKALDSVLSQSYTNLQIIVMDDASSDNTENIVKSYPDSRIEYHKNETNLGITKNRNKALSLSKGKYIAVLDSDDYWINEDKINDQVNFLENNPDHAVIGTYTKFIDLNGDEIMTFKPKTNNTAIRQNILLQNQIVHSSVMFRKDSLKQYDENYEIWEDLVAWLEIGKNYKIANLPVVATAYLKHENNISNNKKVSGIKTLNKIIKNYREYPNYRLAQLKNNLRLVKTILHL